MRLIDADKFIEYMEEKCDTKSQLDPIILAIIIGALEEQPTAYDVDKVVEELEEAKHEICLSDDDLEHYQNGIDDAIEIVKQGGVDDVCEWKMDNVGASIGCRSDLHHTGYVNRTYCP